MTRDGADQFYFGCVTSGEDSALVFINLATLPAFVDGTELAMDATFHTVPRGYYQMASLHVYSYGVVSLHFF